MVNARQKLNRASVLGCFIVAAASGAYFESWAVFLVIAVTMLAASLVNGSIRPKRRRS